VTSTLLPFEIGGERDEQAWLNTLMSSVLKLNVIPSYAVVDLGGHIWNDRQCGGRFLTESEALTISEMYAALGTKTKAHNMDWAGNRRRFEPYVDAINIAPEYAGVECDAWLQVMSAADAEWLLMYAYATDAWKRWFDPDEGTWFDRARCAVRYCMMHDEVRDRVARYRSAEDYVRRRIHDAILSR
jgi:hypothetical protein